MLLTNNAVTNVAGFDHAIFLQLQPKILSPLTLLALTHLQFQLQDLGLLLLVQLLPHLLQILALPQHLLQFLDQLLSRHS